MCHDREMASQLILFTNAFLPHSSKYKRLLYVLVVDLMMLAYCLWPDTERGKRLPKSSLVSDRRQCQHRLLQHLCTRRLDCLPHVGKTTLLPLWCPNFWCPCTAVVIGELHAENWTGTSSCGLYIVHVEAMIMQLRWYHNGSFGRWNIGAFL